VGIPESVNVSVLNGIHDVDIKQWPVPVTHRFGIDEVEQPLTIALKVDSVITAVMLLRSAGRG
jgi:hypothetical protein